MHSYLAIKFQPDASNRPLIEAIAAALEKDNITTTVMARDYEVWGTKPVPSPAQLMAATFKAIDAADFLLVEFSEKGVGLGIEAGYAYAKSKPRRFEHAAGDCEESGVLWGGWGDCREDKTIKNSK